MTELTEQLSDLKALAEAATTDATKFNDGNRSAGVRVRRAMQNIKKTAQKIRVMVQMEANKRKDFSGASVRGWM